MLAGRLHNVLGQIGSKLLIDLPWENVVTALIPSLLIGSPLNMQIRRTSIQSRTSSILGQIGLFVLGLLALERRFFHIY